MHAVITIYDPRHLRQGPNSHNLLTRVTNDSIPNQFIIAKTLSFFVVGPLSMLIDPLPECGRHEEKWLPATTELEIV